ncbi:MAG: hypothetical protein FWE67_16325, partial [Planctomycetaceae bacterium]|nr:hypothetical protein [Planctomycetaceae bacterium]
SPYHLAQAEQAEQADDAPDKKPAASQKDKQKDIEVKADPNRVIPRCKIYIFNTRAALEAKSQENNVPLFGGREHAGGFYDLKANSIYMLRSGSLQKTREILLHEATHFYTNNFLPGGWYCYPDWFREGLSMRYQVHTWNGDNLVIGFPPRLSYFDNPGSGLTGLVRLRTYMQAQGTAAVPETESKTKPAKKTTPIQPELIQPFLDTQFTPELMRRDGVELKHPREEVSHRYAMYQAFGRFLTMARPDILDAILKQISQWENDNVNEPPKYDRFIAAWKKVNEEKPITIEDIGTWLQKNQLTFKWVYGDWQDVGDRIAGLSKDDSIGVLLLRDTKTLPKFTVYPKNLSKFHVGVVFNFIDEKNYSMVIVNESGSVIQWEQRNDVWTPGKTLGKMAPVPGKLGPSFFFAAAQQGNVLRITINKTPVGDYPRIPNSFCGFYIKNTEALFVP